MMKSTESTNNKNSMSKISMNINNTIFKARMNNKW